MKQIEIDFYNPTTSNPADRLKETVAATSQTWAIYKLMADGRKRTSIEVSKQLGINLNSTRRALTDLCRKFKVLQKLPDVKLEEFGKANHYYRLK